MTLPKQLEPLAALPHWVCWRFEPSSNGGKPTKVPYQANGYHASTTRADTWTNAAAVAAVADKYDGRGFVLDETEFAAFDIDDCRDPATGAIHPWAAALVAHVGSYAEITPSGKGLHIIGTTVVGGPFKMPKKIIADGVGCEIFRRKGYITMTGNVYADLPVVNIDQHIAAVLAEFELREPPLRPRRADEVAEAEAVPVDPERIKAALAVIDPDIDRPRWISVGCGLFKQFGEDEGFSLWNEWSSTGTKYKKREMAGQWRSIVRHDGYAYTIGTVFYLANEAAPDWDRAYWTVLGDDLNNRSVELEAAAADFASEPGADGKPQLLIPGIEPRLVLSVGEASGHASGKGSAFGRALAYGLAIVRNVGLAIVRVADVTAKKVDWLWNQRIARGKLTIIAGMPDVNKSTLGLHLAALITTGGALPANEGRVPLGSVIILTAEDDIADTVRPRLEVAGADLTRVHIVTATKATKGQELMPFDLYQDVARLERAIREIGDVVMVIVDPISAYMGKPGKLDTYRNADVRATLAPLQEMAARCSVAVLAIDHLNKSGGTQAMMRVLGSIAFVAAARAVYLVVRDEEEDDRRLFLPAKNNLGKIRTGLAFRVIEKFATTVFDAYPAIKWEDEIVTMTADEALWQKADGRKSEKAEAAKKLINETLTGEPVWQKDIEQRAADRGISHKSLRTAKEALGVVSTKAQDKWWWTLPGQKVPM